MNKFGMPILVAVVASGIGFWGGTYYGENAQVADANAQGAARQAGRSGRSGFAGGPGRQGGGFTAGDVIAKDDMGITVKMRDGGSKIVLIGASAKITKSATGTPADIAVGGRVMVTGTANADGSVTAESVQAQ